MPFIVKIILLELASSFSSSFAYKTKRYSLSFNLNLHLINGVLIDLQKLLRCFNGTTITVFFKIPFAPLVPMFSINLFLYLKESKLLVSPILALKSKKH